MLLVSIPRTEHLYATTTMMPGVDQSRSQMMTIIPLMTLILCATVGTCSTKTPGCITSSPVITTPNGAASSTPTPSSPPARVSSAIICSPTAGIILCAGSIFPAHWITSAMRKVKTSRVAIEMIGPKVAIVILQKQALTVLVDQERTVFVLVLGTGAQLIAQE